MALRRNDPETGRFAREVAELSGECLTEAVRSALIDRLARIGDRFAYAAARSPVSHCCSREMTLPTPTSPPHDRSRILTDSTAWSQLRWHLSAT